MSMQKDTTLNNSAPSESEKLEDILSSIRNMIENQEYKNFEEDEQEPDILELTKIAPKEENTDNDYFHGLISDNVARQSSEMIASLTQNLKSQKVGYEEKPLDNMINQLVRPLLKEWLDNNLSRIVEKIVSEEIKQLVQKK
jgi:cell pole-organizing protein PopZ